MGQNGKVVTGGGVGPCHRLARVIGTKREGSWGREQSVGVDAQGGRRFRRFFFGDWS